MATKGMRQLERVMREESRRHGFEYEIVEGSRHTKVEVRANGQRRVLAVSSTRGKPRTEIENMADWVRQDLRRVLREMVA